MVSAPLLVEGIRIAFLVDAGLAVARVLVSIVFAGGGIDPATLDSLLHRRCAPG